MLVAVYPSNYDRIPVLGKVLEIKTDSVKIHYWKGSFKGKFSPQNLPRRETPWVDELPIDISGETIDLSSANLCVGVKREFLLTNFSTISRLFAVNSPKM